MSLSRRNPRRDANEKAIVKALEAAGVRVWRISGKGLPDLLTLYRGNFVPLEVKTKHGQLTVFQSDAPWWVARTVEAALELVCGIQIRET